MGDIGSHKLRYTFEAHHKGFLSLGCFCRDNGGCALKGQVAQSVEQRTENPRVGGSIPPLAISFVYVFTLPSYSVRYLLLFGFYCLLFGVSFFFFEDTKFSRDGLENGQWWRVITGNFVHINFPHLFTNLVALFAVLCLGYGRVMCSTWVVATLFISVCVTLGVYYFVPSIKFYVGFSGALHGLLAFTALMQRKILVCLGILLLIIAKIAVEKYGDVSIGGHFFGEVRVVFEAHQIGFAAGCFFFFLYRILGRRFTA